ncbi:MAG: tRNA (pseudouridine(54)-N(1))-methyltransferase TrmY [Candidatus Nanoarchaeia archaeon]
MSRTFILYSHATTNPNFDIDELYKAGRLDLVCRCVITALWLSDRIRKDTQILISLNGGPSPPVAIRFDGAKLSGVEPSEKSIAALIKKCLRRVILHNIEQKRECKELLCKEWLFIHEGVFVSKKSFQDLVKDSANVLVLDPKGEQIEKTKLVSPTFVLGDQKGLPKAEFKFCLRKGKALSLGSQIYLASTVIAVVNWVLDKCQK